MTVERALELILGNLGVLVLLIFILVGGYRGWWVYGRHFDAQTARITQLEHRLDRALMAGEQMVGSVDRATTLAERARNEVGHD